MSDNALIKPEAGGPLAPVVYREELFPALRLTRSSRVARRLAKGLFLLLVVSVIACIFAPWQQSITGTGDVVAFAPLERRQIIEAPIGGRVVSWGEGIRENAYVEKGQVVLELQDIDPDLLMRLKKQVEVSETQVDAGKESLAASKRQLEAASTIVEVYEAQVKAFEEVRTQTVAAADEYIKMANNKLEAERRALDAAKAAEFQAEADSHRQLQLQKEGLASVLKMQEAERKSKEATAKREQAVRYVASAVNEVAAKERERDSKDRAAQTKIDSSRAAVRKARADVAKAEAEIAKAEASLTKAEKELVDSESKLAKQEQGQVIKAPRSGYVMQLVAYQGGEYVKAGDPLFELVPHMDQKAVQVWVDGNDAPLIDVDDHVRLQFEGWPAVQFSGWPSVAVGTFGGQVALVDPADTDDRTGKFRVLIIPEKDSHWPDYPYLRQGVRTNAWILLDRVSLGYEIWRRMNGFPPALQSRENEKAQKVPKVKA